MVFVLAGFLGALLLHTSQEVQRAERELAKLELSAQKQKESIHILNAEWHYLNRPERLEALAEQYLDLVPPSHDQVKQDYSALSIPVADESEFNYYSYTLQGQSVAFSSAQDSIIPRPRPRPASLVMRQRSNKALTIHRVKPQAKHQDHEASLNLLLERLQEEGVR